MKAAHLSDADHREVDENFQASESRTSEIPVLQWQAWVFLAMAALGLAGEGALIYNPVHDAIGPLPGEPWSPIPLIVSCSGIICVLAFTLYKRARPNAAPVRFVEFLPGYLAVTFLLIVGVKLSDLIFSNGASEAVPFELFGEESASAEPSLLKRFFGLMDGPFALIFGLLTICNLYVTEYAITRLREILRKLHEFRKERADARAAMDEFQFCGQEIARLECERGNVLRGLEPAAAQGFAQELAALIAEEIAPMEGWIAAQGFRKKSADSIFGVQGETNIDAAKLKERIAAMRADDKVIYAAFRGDKVK